VSGGWSVVCGHLGFFTIGTVNTLKMNRNGFPDIRRSLCKSRRRGSTFPETTHHEVELNGTRLHYVSAGKHGSPVLLVHGFPETWWTFREVIPLLAASHRVFAVDLRGFGDSDNEPGGTAGVEPLVCINRC
jgi:hypothetical protein